MKRKMRSTRPVSWKLQNITSEKALAIRTKVRLLLAPIVLAKSRDASETGFPLGHGLAEDHDQSADNRQIAEEEIEVKDETIAKALEDNDSKKTTDSEFRVFLRHDSPGPAEHRLLFTRICVIISIDITGGIKATYNDIDEEEDVADAPREGPVSVAWHRSARATETPVHSDALTVGGTRAGQTIVSGFGGRLRGK